MKFLIRYLGFDISLGDVDLFPCCSASPLFFWFNHRTEKTCINTWMNDASLFVRRRHILPDEAFNPWSLVVYHLKERSDGRQGDQRKLRRRLHLQTHKRSVSFVDIPVWGSLINIFLLWRPKTKRVKSTSTAKQRRSGFDWKSRKRTSVGSFLSWNRNEGEKSKEVKRAQVPEGTQAIHTHLRLCIHSWLLFVVIPEFSWHTSL